MREMKADIKDNYILGKLLFTRIRKHDPKFLSTYQFIRWGGDGGLFVLLYNPTRCESSFLFFFLSAPPLDTVLFLRGH